MIDFERYLSHIRAQVREVTPAQASEAAAAGALLIDLRDPAEIQGGMAAGARHLPKAFLEPRIVQLAHDPHAPIVLMCASGLRSALGAATLMQMGYTDVVTVAGGFKAWQDLGLATEVPTSLTEQELRRYARHLSIPEVGEHGQHKLKRARVLLIGCGGLGSPVALYLAAAGVGTLTLVDHDVVDESNLQRQVLFVESDVKLDKVEAARQRLEQLNSRIIIHTVNQKLTEENIDGLVLAHDLVVDGTDNFTARYIIGDGCARNGKPLVHGSIYRFDGQVSVFRNDGKGPCYRCIYPEPPPAELAPSCMEAGVLGVLPGVIGTLQSVEALKLILGIGESLDGTLLTYDALDASFSRLSISRKPQCTHGARVIGTLR